jgi:hypothetical protein
MHAEQNGGREPRLVCSLCGNMVRVIGLETVAGNHRKELLTFECARGHVVTVVFPE